MRSASILIIEDHASLRTLMAQVLEDAGYEVYEATNGRQGLERFRTQPANLVITDLEMPEMNGLEIILELTRAFLDVKVIAMNECFAGRRSSSGFGRSFGNRFISMRAPRRSV
jgi:CheY-like chemotaxis protein